MNKKAKFTVIMDFTKAYEKENEWLNEEWEGFDEIPTEPKKSLWKRIKQWFTKK